MSGFVLLSLLCNLFHSVSRLVAAVTGTLTCEEGKTYFSVTKKCISWGNEESYQILSGGTVLQTSAAFAKTETRTDEYCLTSSTNDQYTFKMIDSVGDSWDSGAWVSVAGLYGNVVFKYYLTTSRQEEYDLSMFYAIKKGQEWKMHSSTDSVPSDWAASAFSDNAWSDVTLGSEIAAVSGTQYFRKHFTSVAGLAAYELELNYRYGLIAYVNGVEVFRDNMPSDSVTPSTASTGSYDSYDYRGVIRPANEVEGANAILAVELHFPAATENAMEFDAYMAVMASSVRNSEADKCYIYPYPVTIFSAAPGLSEYIFDYGKSSGANIMSTQLPAVVSFEMGGPRPFINGLRVWPYSSPTNTPGTFTFQGAADSSSPSWATVIGASGMVYTANTYRMFNSYFSAATYRSYRLNVPNAGMTASLYEFQPAVCVVVAPQNMEFSPASYSFYAYYDEAEIKPTIGEFMACTVQPALPSGMMLDAATCTVHGKATTALASTVFTMSAAMGERTVTGTFTMEVTTCAGTLTTILRTYKYSAYYETFSIKDMATQQVVLSVAYNAGQTSYEDWTSVLCLTGAKYEIDMGSSMGYWQSQSFLYVNAMLLNNEYDTIVRAKMDNKLGLSADRIVDVQWSVAPQSQWFYKMNEVPANWYNGETSGWSTGAMEGFTGATNQIQLYKKTFNAASVSEVAGIVISLRYLYGCVIYLNGNEVFRNGVTGELSASSVGLNAYTDLMYRKITLPVKTIATDDTPAVNYLVEGSNTIAIAIVAQTASQTTSVFDCAVRLMGTTSSSRVFDYTVTSTSIYGDTILSAYHYYGYAFYQSLCATNDWTIAFNNDRREWVSSVTLYLYYEQNTQHPRQFVLKARNSNLEDWTVIKNVTGMTWSLKGEHKKLWLENSKPWNQYRLENIATGDSSNCAWRLGAIDLSSDATGVTIPDLSYASPVVVTKGIEMGEVYPNSEYYFDFSITPALPSGLAIDPNTGKISGTCNEVVPSTVYQIQATKFGGGRSTFALTLSVDYCMGTRSLITLVARLDTWPDEGSYKLFSGKGTSGEVLASLGAFTVQNGLNYADWCLAHNIYTVALYDSRKDGWENPAGYYLTVDSGAMIFEMGQVPVDVESVSTMFSSLLPFQVEYDDWKLLNSAEAVVANWNSVDFDDSRWQTVKAAAFGNHVGTTAYVRHEVSIPSIEDYHVLNVRVKYAGGVVAYFNGRIVARFNLAESFDANTEAIAVHDATAFSNFHIVLPTVGAVTGKNVIAFEIHRASGASAIVFDATGVFGVNDCSITLDTYAAIDSSEVSGCTKENLMNLEPGSYGYIPNTVGSFLSWTVENLEGSKSNSFAIQFNSVASNYAFSVYGRWSEDEDYTSALAVTEQSTRARERNAWSMPVGIAGFTQFKFEVDNPASSAPSTNAYFTQYCRASGAGSCPAIDDYPSVGEGEISPAMCPEGFRGYTYRECANGQLGEVKSDKCEYKFPDNISYLRNDMEFVMGTEVTSGAPTYKNIITEFYMQESTPLPAGLRLNPTTGEISGVPAETVEAKEYVVRGKNPKGETYVTISIRVRKGYCAPEGVFERTPVGEVAVYQCALQGSYVGSQKRACVLGKVDGEWQQATGFCMPVFGIIAIVVIAIVIVAMIVFFVMRSTRKAKAVGGVKGKTVKKTKAPEKKMATKAVKV